VVRSSSRAPALVGKARSSNSYSRVDHTIGGAAGQRWSKSDPGLAAHSFFPTAAFSRRLDVVTRIQLGPSAIRRVRLERRSSFRGPSCLCAPSLCAASSRRTQPAFAAPVRISGVDRGGFDPDSQRVPAFRLHVTGRPPRARWRLSLVGIPGSAVVLNPMRTDGESIFEVRAAHTRDYIVCV